MRLSLDGIRNRIKRPYKTLKKKLNRKKTKRHLFFIGSVVLIGLTGSALLINNNKDNRQKLLLMQEVHTKQQEADIKAQVIDAKTQQVQEAEKQKVEVEQQKAQTEQKLKETEQKVQQLDQQLQSKKASQARYASVQKNNYPSSSGKGGRLIAGTYGYARPCCNCVNEPGVNKGPYGNPIVWPVLSYTPTIGATALWTYNHTGVVVGLWDNGDVEVRHQNYSGGQSRFPRSAFRGFR